MVMVLVTHKRSIENSEEIRQTGTLEIVILKLKVKFKVKVNVKVKVKVKVMVVVFGPPIRYPQNLVKN